MWSTTPNPTLIPKLSTNPGLCESEYVGMNFGMKPGECLVLVSKSKGREDFTDVSLHMLWCVSLQCSTKAGENEHH